MVTYREFGQLLSVARKARGQSQLEVSIAACVHPSFYARVERGLRMVSLITFALIWRHLEVDAGPLLAALPVEVAEPNKQKRQPKRPGAASLAELACLLSDFDRLMARARNDAGLTQEELAEAVGLSSRHIGRIECGHGLPSLTAFARIHRVLGFDVNRALGCLLGRDVPRLPSGPFPGVLRAVKRIARTPRSPVAFLGQAASGRLWRAGPLLSVSVHDDWQCQCDEQRQTASTLASFDTCGMPAELCIGSLPVAIRLQDTARQMSFLLLAWDAGDEIEIRQPGLDGSLDTSNASPSAFMAALYGLAVAECGMDIGRLGNVLRVIAFINRQCLTYVKNRGLATPHG